MTHFDVAKLRQDLIEYQEDMASPGFWDNLERAQRVSAHAHQTESKIQHYESLSSRADDIEVMMELAEEEDDDSMAAEIRQELESVREELDALVEKTILWFRENAFVKERLGAAIDRVGVDAFEAAIATDDLLLRKDAILAAPLKEGQA